MTLLLNTTNLTLILILATSGPQMDCRSSTDFISKKNKI